MIDAERAGLIEEQNILMKLYEEVEADPERYGDDYQSKLNCFDNQADYIRGLLDGRWAHDI